MRYVYNLCSTSQVWEIAKKKDWLTRRTPIPQKSAQQVEIDRLHRLLKHALILRDGPRCIGPFIAHHPALDCSHIFPKSVYTHLRFYLDDCVLQCRTCHEWFGEHPEEGGDWIRTVISKERYDRLLAKAIVSLQDPSPVNLPVWERILKQQIAHSTEFSGGALTPFVLPLQLWVVSLNSRDGQIGNDGHNM
jgi:5-methylcytosine-specific restriction endonuclease McrA